LDDLGLLIGKDRFFGKKKKKSVAPSNNVVGGITIFPFGLEICRCSAVLTAFSAILDEFLRVAPQQKLGFF
jgi:hypothetical protein